MQEAQAAITTEQAKAQGAAAKNQSAAQLDNAKTQNKARLAVVDVIKSQLMPQPQPQGGPNPGAPQ